MENVLRIEKILDFCDVPQLFVARDAFDTLYLCLLYEDELLCRYTGIRISARRLEDFLSGGIDLRSLFIHPENKHEYFDVVFQTGQYQHERLTEKSLPEDKLPASPGIRYNAYLFSLYVLPILSPQHADLRFVHWYKNR